MNYRKNSLRPVVSSSHEKVKLQSNPQEDGGHQEHRMSAERCSKQSEP